MNLTNMVNVKHIYKHSKLKCTVKLNLKTEKKLPKTVNFQTGITLPKIIEYF